MALRKYVATAEWVGRAWDVDSRTLRPLQFKVDGVKGAAMDKAVGRLGAQVWPAGKAEQVPLPKCHLRLRTDCGKWLRQQLLTPLARRESHP